VPAGGTAQTDDEGQRRPGMPILATRKYTRRRGLVPTLSEPRYRSPSKAATRRRARYGREAATVRRSQACVKALHSSGVRILDIAPRLSRSVETGAAQSVGLIDLQH